MDSLKENGIDTEEIWEICENVFFSVNGVKNANKR